MSQINSSPRYPWLDAIRSLAIYLMVIFHFSYDLDVFGHVDIDFQRDVFWLWFPCVIVFLFLLSVGASLRQAHFPERRWPSFWKRWLKIVAGALAVSLGTYIAFPNNWVYFGTLHNIAVTSLICLPFFAYPRAALLLSITIIIGDFFVADWPWWKMAHSSVDYIPPLPWLAWPLLGIYLHSIGAHKLPYPEGRVWRLLTWPGKHSLIIYLLHQVVLYGLIWGFTVLLR